MANDRDVYEARVRASRGMLPGIKFDPDVYAQDRVPYRRRLERYPEEYLPDPAYPHPPGTFDRGWPLGLLAILGVAGGVGWLARRRSASSRDPSGLPRARVVR